MDILGGFCNAIPRIFGFIDAFFDLLGEIDAIIGKALEIYDKIRSYDNFLEFVEQEIIKKLIDEIKQKILDVINGIIQDIREAIERFDIFGILSDDGVSFDVKLAKAILTAKEQMCAALSEDNTKTFIKRIEAGIDYIISLIESPSLETIQLVVARICALAANIEALIRDVKSPLDNFGVNYQRVVNRVANIGKIGTSTAIANGAIRYSPEKRKNTINRLKALHNERVTKSIDEISYKKNSGQDVVNIAPITKEEYGDMPKCGSVLAGNEPRLAVKGDWLDIEELGPEGYSKIDVDVKVYLMRIQKEIGGQIVIVEGWRSKEYNEKVGGAKDSSHLSGLVVDIEKPSTDTDLFAEIALRSGFKHIVIYGDKIHLDMREMGR